MEQKILNPLELQKQKREILITARTREEQKFNNWKRALLTCSKEDVLDKLEFDASTVTLQEWIPELYEESPRVDVYRKQLAEANRKINVVNEMINELNIEGARLLQEFNSLHK